MVMAKAAWIAALIMAWTVCQAGPVSDSARARITLIIPPSFKVDGLSQMQATGSRQYQADSLCLRGPRTMDYSLQVRDSAGQPSPVQADFVPRSHDPNCHGQPATLQLSNNGKPFLSDSPVTLMIIAE